MRRRALLVLLLLPAAVRAQPGVPADSLREDEAVRMAITTSPAARAARARLAAARSARALSRSPLVEAAEAEVSTTLGPTLLPEADDHTTEAGVSVTLERPAVRRARRAAADAALDAATLDARATLDALAYSVRTAFAELRAQEAVARLAALLHADADTLVAAIALRERYGDASELDLRLARLDAVRAAADADEAVLEAAETRARLAALLGTTATALPPLAAAPPPAALPVADSLAARPPALVAAEARVRAAEAAARSARAGLGIPTVTLHGALEYSRLFFGPDDLEAEAPLRDAFRRLGRADVGFTVGVSLPLPFGSPAGRAAALAEAEARAQAAEAAQAAAELSAEAEVARVRLRRAQMRQARYRSAGTDVAESLSLLRLAYEGGEIGLEALLAGRARLYETLVATLRADADAARARLDLARALGPLLTGDDYVPDALLDR